MIKLERCSPDPPGGVSSSGKKGQHAADRAAQATTALAICEQKHGVLVARATLSLTTPTQQQRHFSTMTT
jgi:hypothetical protein